VILADTSVWVDHLRHANARMASLLKEGEIAGYPFVIEEFALGHRSGLWTLDRRLATVASSLGLGGRAGL
jgi:predicted nucleic acid-binding protein